MAASALTSALARIATSACFLAGCASDNAGRLSPLAGPAFHPPTARFATIALDDGQLRAVRGGFDLGNGTVLQFAVQQATYVDHVLVDSASIPPLTLTGGAHHTVSGLMTGANGQVSNLFLSTANGQLVQQVTRVEIAIGGLHGLAPAGLPSQVLDMLRTSQALPR